MTGCLVLVFLSHCNLEQKIELFLVFTASRGEFLTNVPAHKRKTA